MGVRSARSAPGAHRAPGRNPEHVADVLAALYYDTAMGGSPHTLLPALQVTGTDHLLCGSDAGAAPPPPPIRAIDALTTALHGTALHAVEQGNALRLFPRPATR